MYDENKIRKWVDVHPRPLDGSKQVVWVCIVKLFHKWFVPSDVTQNNIFQ